MATSTIANTRRRGSVYWWRRVVTVPGLAPSKLHPITLELSLRTKEARCARERASALTAYSERVRMSFRSRVLTEGLEQQAVAKLFAEEMRAYHTLLIHLEAAWATTPEWGAVNDRDRDLLAYHKIWSGVAEHGFAGVSPQQFVERHCAEFDEETRAGIKGLLRRGDALATGLEADAIQCLQRMGERETPLRLAVVQRTIARARAEAAKQLQADGDAPDLLRSRFPLNESHAVDRWATVDPFASASATMANVLPQAGPLTRSKLTPDQQEFAKMSPTAVAERYLATAYGHLDHRSGSKRPARTVGDSTYRDFKWAALLLQKSLDQPKPFAEVSLNDLVNLDRLFDTIPISFGKSVRDRRASLTLEQVKKEAEESVAAGSLDSEKVGLSVATTNKHWHSLARLHDYLRQNVPTVSELDFARFITPDDKSAREARDPLTVDQGIALFSLPPWTGCAGVKRRLEPGPHIIHDGLYWVPLLVWYTGARREEVCKLMLSDIKINGGTACIMFRNTETGRVKSSNSRRTVPLHAEILRLGFSRFVEKMSSQGETLLFPDLYPAPGTKRTIGDVFFRMWWSELKKHIPDLKPGQGLHAVRHTVAGALRNNGIALEDRNDILGHSQKGLGEGAERYPGALNVEIMRSHLDLVPVITDHLPTCTESILLPKEYRKPRPSRQRGVHDSEK